MAKWMVLISIFAVIAAALAAEGHAGKHKKRKLRKICGSDGKQYPNKCAFWKQKCHVDQQLFPKPMKYCKRVEKEGADSMESKRQMRKKRRARKMRQLPICASNGQTYANYCEFILASCEDKSIRPAFEGTCEDCSEANVCPEKVNRKARSKRGRKKRRICGSDGNFYSNHCELKKQRCKNIQDGAKYLDITKMRKCRKNRKGV